MARKSEKKQIGGSSGKGLASKQKLVIVDDAPMAKKSGCC